MTDTTNHAEALRIALEVIRDNRHLNNGVTLQDVAAEALTALDALTREAEETKRSLRIQADHAAELEKAEVAQSARIATLEEALTAILGRDHHLYCVCGRAMSRIPEGVREQARAALAPSKGER